MLVDLEQKISNLQAELNTLEGKYAQKIKHLEAEYQKRKEALEKKARARGFVCGCHT
jgi:peptidoglycan hydrolase CwlO-like protein